MKDGVRGFYTDPSRADDSFVPFKSVAYLGLDTSFDLTSYPNYKNFTVDDFIVEAQNASTKYNTSYNGYVYDAFVYGRLNKSYNATTGVLTASYSCIGGNSAHQQVESNAKVKAYLLK